MRCLLPGAGGIFFAAIISTNAGAVPDLVFEIMADLAVDMVADILADKALSRNHNDHLGDSHTKLALVLLSLSADTDFHIILQRVN